MQKHKKKLIILSSVVIFSVFVFLAVFNINRVVAAQPAWDETNVSGWNWSGIGTENIDTPEFTHIGWFSNNCYNYFTTDMESRCGTRYGVRVDPVSGDITGYSWNGILDDSGAVTGVGWLDFAPQPFPGQPYYSARVEPVGSPYAGQVSGWARIKSIKEAGEYLGYEDWGWILLGPAPSTNRQFGVNIDFATNNVSGYAWAGGHLANDQLPPSTYENVTTGLGWISFDPVDTDVNLASGALEGYAWIGNTDKLDVLYDTNIGWIALNCNTAGAGGANVCATSDFKVSVDSVSGNVSGYAWIGESSDGNPIGWIDFDPNPYPESPDYSAKVFLDSATAAADSNGNYQLGDVVGWARLISLQKEGAKGHFENWGWVKMHATDDDTVDYGVSMSIDTGEFDGDGWSGGGTECIGLTCYNESVGLGWISFSDYTGVSQLPPTYVAPFLQTVQGDVYSKEGVGSGEIFNLPTSPLTAGLFYNSTFLIQTGGAIQRYTSESGSDYLRPGYDPLVPPLATNKYTNVMGKLDLDGITSRVEVLPGDFRNKFGNVVEVYPGGTLGQNLWLNGLSQLQGKVYHIQGDLTVDLATEIQSGLEVQNETASGTVVVDGDMYIEQNITYQPTDAADTELKDIPSVVWIVKGSVHINPNVSKVAGNFVVVGEATGGSLVGGTGEFYTGAGDENLVISGLVIAHELFLQRSGIGTVEDIQAAERIFYDGRIIINTPPGIGDFAEALPVVREVAPIEITP
ncbi:MAG: hypothetical protein WCT33_00575 [Patescibacteria group bacterium]